MPSFPPTARCIASTARTLAPPAGWKPVEVLTKSAPARATAWHRASIRSSPASSPSALWMAAVSRITLSTTGGGTASRIANTSAITSSTRPAMAAPTSITMSTSAAPWSTASRPSIALTSEWCLPDGKPATVATICLSGRTGSIAGLTHTALTPSSRASSRQSCTSSRDASGESRVWSIIEATRARVS